MMPETVKNEQGFVLIVSLLMLVVLMIIGIAATTTTTIDLQISGNDKVAKKTFYQADAGSEAGIEIVEECIRTTGFDGNSWYGVTINNVDLYMNDTFPAGVDASFTQGSETTNLKFVAGATHTTPGSGSQMAAGYEGKGKGAASGGAFKVYDIQSQHQGAVNSEAIVWLQWRHML